MNYTSGIYTATEPRNHLVTLTAQIADTNGNDGHRLFSYAQLFVLKNGKLESLNNYLLVEQNKVGDLRMEIHLKRKDTLEVFVGHHIDSKQTGGGRYGVEGFFLEDVRFCIF